MPRISAALAKPDPGALSQQDLQHLAQVVPSAGACPARECSDGIRHQEEVEVYLSSSLRAMPRRRGMNRDSLCHGGMLAMMRMCWVMWLSLIERAICSLGESGPA